MQATAIGCAFCSGPLPAEFWNRPAAVRCPNCGHLMQAAVFSAVSRAPDNALPDPIRSEGEASCFFHPPNLAVAPCDQCGRFLCRLCDLEVEGRHWCSSCLTAAVAARKVAMLDSRRTLYDSIALALATLPVLFWPLLILTAPAALFMVFHYRRSPRSIVPRSRVRFVLAGIFALIDIGTLIWIFRLLSLATRSGF